MPVLPEMKGIWMLRGWEVGSWAEFWVVVIRMFGLIQGAAFIMHDDFAGCSRRRQ
jgi:hypothetical protein